MRIGIVFSLLLLSGCVYQDLKAPYEVGPSQPVNNQWKETPQASVPAEQTQPSKRHTNE